MQLIVRRAASLALAAALAGSAQAATENLVVTANRTAQPALDLIGNTVRIDEQAMRLVDHQHIYELGARAAGTWLSRGSGQENLTAIRSPVLTGPGACGAFLVLEDGIPTRPTGFCNVNELFEVDSELAAATEVIRGPAGAAYGSNGLHGTLNFLLPAPGEPAGLAADAEAGPDEYRRGRASGSLRLGQVPVSGGLLLDHYGGFQNDTGYDQQKLFLKSAPPLAGGNLELGFSGSFLDQETAGYIRGKDAYKDPVLRTTNPNPEAFRKADSQRAYLRWWPAGDEDLDLRVYLRRSDMEFLQHFLPGQPLEENGQLSGGFMTTLRRPLGAGTLTTGVDGEWARGYLRETQFQDLGPDSSRPTGRHYDYDVNSLLGAAWAQLEQPLAAAWTLQAGLRVEYLRYDYSNNMRDGDTREDGSPCTDTCLFYRPGNRSDGFLEAAPNLGLLWRLAADTSIYLNLARGFRAPQATELYRLQSGQRVGDLQPETLDSLELGWRRVNEAWSVEAVAFAMRKQHYIFRDADAINVSDGKSRHLGVELQADWRGPAGLYAGLAATWARHTYAFDRAAVDGEPVRDGDDVDTAPRTLGSAHLGVDRGPVLAELEWLHQGGYYLDAANTARYGGHDLLNLRTVWRLTADWSLALRVNNLTDRLYADRADFAFGSYRYFPGREREVFVQLSYGSF